MKAKDVLSAHQLKRTSCREGIIDVMMDSRQALSENEIRDQLPGNYDRTTFYRSFKTLVENHIIHRIVIDNLIVKYGLDVSVSNRPVHPHFYCKDCHTVRCLDEIPVQSFNLPEGYKSLQTEVIIKGTCAICQGNYLNPSR